MSALEGKGVSMGMDDQESNRSTGSPGSDGVEHLQAAASEMIAAARSFIDAVEGVVHDRDALESLVDTLSSVAQAASQAVSKVAPNRSRPQPTSADAEGASRVQHIRVS